MNHINYHSYSPHFIKKSKETDVTLKSGKINRFSLRFYSDIPRTSIYVSQDLYFLHYNSKDVEIIKNVRKGIFQGLKTLRKRCKTGPFSTDNHMLKNTTDLLTKKSKTRRNSRTSSSGHHKNQRNSTGARDKCMSVEEKSTRSKSPITS
ncbi:unnamed protein product [Schistosoma margrebowiei]|uniref:Uncharacterized protein n=1 Tax=Schistosoma margrebowiei TaxID=48269 RepID=A0AA85A060_9TREM|nr:unnamed protein product [Schistosoma margrebowiei]